ncbi:MAG: hypothetical protein AAF577_12415 [Pseudomonadota bacterium]
MTSSIVTLGEIWLIAGAVVAGGFLLLGLDRVEPNARGAYGFRALIIPGLVLIWPLVLWRWAVLASGGWDERRRHAPPRRAQAAMALTMAIGLPAILASALILRPSWPGDAPAVLIAPPPALSPASTQP